MKKKAALASYIFRHDGTFCLAGTLMEVKGTVALRPGNDSLDNLGLESLLVLAHLCTTDKPTTLDSISYVTEIDKSILKDSIDTLLEFDFVEILNGEYSPTTKANQIIQELAKELLEFDSFKYKQGLQEIESLKKLT